MTIEEMNIGNLSDDDLFEIACIIDNEYRQYRDSRGSVGISKTLDGIYIRTNRCDWCSFIRIKYNTSRNITDILVMGEYTKHGYEPVTNPTLNRIALFYNQTTKP